MLTPQQDPASGTASSSPATTGESEIWLADHVRRAVTAHSANDDVETMAALDDLCAAARHAGMPIERVLVLLKQLWQPRTADVPLRAGPTDDRLARLVSSCISRYYDRS